MRRARGLRTRQSSGTGPRLVHLVSCPAFGPPCTWNLDTTITVPVGVEAYAAYALRAWLSGGHQVSTRTRRFVK